MAVKVGVLLISLFIGSLALPQPTSNIDWHSHVDTSARVVGGTPAAEGSVPYMVAMTNGIVVRSFLCGGSVVKPKLVLTAAHCISAVFSASSGLSSSLFVVVGTNRWNLGGTSYSITRNVTHPHYVSSTIKNDIGLLISSSDIEYSSLVRPVALSFEEVGGGVVSRAAGFGRIVAGGALSTSLLELTLETIDGQQCIEDVRRAGIEFNTNPPPIEPHLEICTIHSPGHGMCNGDSGSALVRTDTQQQIAIVSWGFPCARGAPDMFVRVSAYEDWFKAAAADV